jgi:predicted peroxiredoxin
VVCSPSIQACKNNPEDLIPQAQIIAGATLVAKMLSAMNVVSY